ncbi:MAG: histidine phosphatase family protein, partial [Oscillospiraceae bacterium]
VQGITDNPITQKGAFQLECLANEMASYKIDKIYSSGLKRAIDTAQCIAEKINEKVIIDNSITEINFGLMEDKLWSDIPKLFPKEYNDWVYKMYEMEP